MKRTRRNHKTAFKGKGALAAFKDEKTLAQLAQQYDVHVNQITTWKAQLLERVSEVFASAAERKEASGGPSVKDMQAKIGQLALENDFLAVALGRMDDASAKR